MLREIAYQWGRFAWWLSQGTNSTALGALAAVLSVGVTAILTPLTFYIVRATYRQARAMLQPALKLETTFYNDPQHPKYDALRHGSWH